MKIDRTQFDKARTFVEANARPVDKALFAFYFENGSPEAVLTELAALQNPDGGFGHGMEPDFRTPASSPMATSVGLQYGVAVDAAADHKLVKAAIRYLLESYDIDDDYWPSTYLDVNDAPHAPWWHVDKIESPSDEAWPNPSAELVGYLHRYANLVPADILQKATEKARSVLGQSPTIEGFYRYNLLCWQRAAPYLPSDLQQAALDAIAATFTKYPFTEENFGEVSVLWLAPDPDSTLAKQLGSDLDTHLDKAIKLQAEDGAWHPTWEWGQYEDAWQIAKREWSGKMTVEALHVLDRFGRLER